MAVDPWVTTAILNIKKAIATGARRTRIKDEEMEFRTLEEMQQTLAWLEGLEAAETPGARKRRGIHFITHSGW